MNSFYIALVILATIQLVYSTESRLEQRSKFGVEDFVFDFNNATSEGSGDGGTIKPANIESFPALGGEGVSYTLFTLKACAVNLPHVHQRVCIWLVGKWFIFVLNYV